MPEVFVGAGSNQDAQRYLQQGCELLAQRFGSLRLSAVYQNPAVGFDGDDFLNLVIGLHTDEPMAEVMAGLRAIEDACGRDRSGPRFGPRTLDFDLLLYGDAVDVAVNVPRDEILQRAFVLKPLLELAPDGVHPVSGETLAAHWARFDQAAAPMQRLDWQPRVASAR